MMKRFEPLFFKLAFFSLFFSIIPLVSPNPLLNVQENEEKFQAYAGPIDPSADPAASDDGEHDFAHGFVKALIIIIISELGDKTFFIAAIFAMKHKRTIVFAGAIGALALMTALSVAIGFATMIIPRQITFYGSVGLFAVFGVKMLHEGYTMDAAESQEELEEVEGELKKKDDELEKAKTVGDLESGGGSAPAMTFRQKVFSCFSPILLQSFTLTFLAEWGDRSQITTIIQAASEDAWGVLFGATLGHSICTGIAVIGGRMIAQRISVKTVTLIGGLFFLLNAAFSLATGPGSS